MRRRKNVAQEPELTLEQQLAATLETRDAARKTAADAGREAFRLDARAVALERMIEARKAGEETAAKLTAEADDLEVSRKRLLRRELELRAEGVVRTVPERSRVEEIGIEIAERSSALARRGRVTDDELEALHLALAPLRVEREELLANESALALENDARLAEADAASAEAGRIAVEIALLRDEAEEAPARAEAAALAKIQHDAEPSPRRRLRPKAPIHALVGIGNGLVRDAADGRIYNQDGFPVLFPD